MDGFVLLDSRGRKLTRYRFWSKKPEAGWLWSLEEANEILRTARDLHWKHKPAYFQRCTLLWSPDGLDNMVSALEEAQRLDRETTSSTKTKDKLDEKHHRKSNRRRHTSKRVR